MTNVTINRGLAIDMSDLLELNVVSREGDRRERIFNAEEPEGPAQLSIVIAGGNLRLNQDGITTGVATRLNLARFEGFDIRGGIFEDFRVSAADLYDTLVSGDTAGFISLLFSGDDRFTVANLRSPAVLDGGEGNDWLDLADAWGTGSDVPLEVNLARGTSNVGVSFDNFEAVLGGIGDDILRGTNGDDTLAGNFGEDRLIGRRGEDWADYSRTTGEVDQGIAADLRRGLVRKDGLDDENAVDRLRGIEGLIGTLEDDRMRGDGGTNYFAGLGGEDVMVGARGADWVVYGFDAENGGSGGVRVDLARNGAIDGFGDRDVLRSIENVLGTDNRDVIAGNGRDNVIFGADGRDILVGRGGDDTFVFRNGDKRDLIRDFTQGEDAIDLTLASVDTFDDLAIRTRNGNALVSWEDSQTLIILDGVRGNVLTEDDFIF